MQLIIAEKQSVARPSPPKSYIEDTLLSAMETAEQRDAAPSSGCAGEHIEMTQNKRVRHTGHPRPHH